jgi:hypothetical protein
VRIGTAGEAAPARRAPSTTLRSLRLCVEKLRALPAFVVKKNAADQKVTGRVELR